MNKNILFLIFLTLLTLQTQRTQRTFSQWYKQQIPVVNQQIYGIKFLDTLNGWACTSKYNATQQDTAFILHTTNGGINWFIQYYKPTIQGYSAITIVNNMVGYAAGDSLYPPYGGGCILIKTTNGGLNWFNIPIPYNMSISQFYFLNPDTGWEADNGASSPDIRLTTDGGYTWQVRINGITSYPNNYIFFLNYNTGWCGAGNILYKTTNIGNSWQVNGAFSDNVSSIFFLNENTGWAGLSGDTVSKVAYTSNSGLNWQMQYLRPFLSNITELYFYNKQLGWAGISYIEIYKTINSGVNWGYQSDTSSSLKFSIVDSLHGWSGFIGISHTSNGGGTITYIGITNISNKIPNKYKLYQNYPNPFNPSTKIRFSLIKPSYVQIKIFDESGKELNPWIFGWYPETLLEAGIHEFQIDGSEMSSGVYFFKLIVTDEKSNVLYTASKKMILVK